MLFKHTSTRKLKLILFLIALLAHLLVFALMIKNYGVPGLYFSQDGSLTGYIDAQHYILDAKNVVEGNGFSRYPNPPFEPDTFRTPLLPMYFMPFIYFGGVSAIGLAIFILNIILCFVPVVTFAIANQFVSKSASFFVGIAMAFEPLFLYRSQITEPDPLFTLFFITAVYLVLKWWETDKTRNLYMAAGLFALATLTKPVGTWIFVISLLVSICYALKSRKPFMKVILISIIIFCTILFPWLVRNRIVSGVWGLSAVLSYNFYYYYTETIHLPNEKNIDETTTLREPARSLTFNKEYRDIAFERIKHHPIEYAKQHLIGTVRNLLTTEISSLYYNNQLKLLPFNYNPVGEISLRNTIASGDFRGAIHYLLSGKLILKVLWWLILFAAYASVLYAGYISRKNTHQWFAFLMFILFIGYFALGPGLYVDAKYRLPYIPLVFIAIAYSISHLRKRYEDYSRKEN